MQRGSARYSGLDAWSIFFNAVGWNTWLFHQSLVFSFVNLVCYVSFCLLKIWIVTNLFNKPIDLISSGWDLQWLPDLFFGSRRKLLYCTPSFSWWIKIYFVRLESSLGYCIRECLSGIFLSCKCKYPIVMMGPDFVTNTCFASSQTSDDFTIFNAVLYNPPRCASSQLLVSLLARMLHADPMKRPTMEVGVWFRFPTEVFYLHEHVCSHMLGLLTC